MSDHQDVIIYDQQSSPVYKYEGANQIVSADAVAAIMEVKAVLNKTQLEEAYAKIEEVKRLRKRPISEMDQPATESTLATTGTLGIIFGFGSDISLDKLAEHCVELNEKYETAHRPDMIVLLDVGVINYRVQFVGGRDAGDLAPAAGDEFVIPPCFVHLVTREDGASCRPRRRSEDPIQLANSTMPQLPHQCNRRQPAEAFFDSLPLSLESRGLGLNVPECSEGSRAMQRRHTLLVSVLATQDGREDRGYA